MARQLGLSPTTFKNHYEKWKAQQSRPIQGQVTEFPVPRQSPSNGSPAVHPGGPPALEAIQADLLAMVQWWRERQMRRVDPGGPRDTERWTVHVARQWIAQVKEEAEAEGVDIKTIVDRAFRQYFEGR